MHETPRARLVAYSVAVLAPAVSLLLRWPLWPVLGDAVPHMTFFPAVMIAAYFGGFWPGFLATILSVGAANYFLTQQLPSFQVKSVNDGVAVILTTHFMEEAEQLADHVVIIDHGRTVADGSPVALTGSAGQLRFRAERDLDIDSLLTALPAGSAAKESPAGRYLIEVPGGTVQPALLAAVTAWCADRGVLPSSLQIESRTLEDVFLELTGRDLRG